MKRYAALCGLFILAIYAPFCEARPVFATLTEAQEYAESIPEYVETENNDWLNPEFTSYHKSLNPGFARRFFNWFGVGKKEWNAPGFKKLLISLTKQRELHGFMGEFVQKYRAQAGDRIFIWTDLFGAFHSLIRDLVELRSKGILSDDLKIIKSDQIFVFNGNVISHSPYTLETLTLVMRLLELNPQQVIYVRGGLEEKQEWHSYGLARELKIRGSQLSREIIPLNREITQFFNTLPLGLFLPKVSEKEINVVLLVNNEHTKSGFDTKRIAGFLANEDDERLSSFKLANQSISKKKVQVKALISGEDRSITYHQTDGLTMLGMQREALQWIVFSSPTSRNRRLYEFFYDAFAEISVTDQLDDWTITLYNRDVRKLSGFKKVATYDLLTGQKSRIGLKKKKRVEKKELEKKEVEELPKEPIPAKKVQEDKVKQEAPSDAEKEEVVFGSTIDLSKSASPIGKPVKEGLDMAFKKATQEGGAGQFLPRIIIYDDEYTPTKTRKLVADLMNKSNIDIFLNSVGSPTTESYLDVIKDGKVLVLFPYTGAPIFRKPELKNIAHMRVGYVDEGKALAEYAIDKLRARKIVIFYQNDAFGRGALQGAMEVIEKKGIKDVVKVPYERNDVQFDQQAKIIEQADPDTIFFFAVTPSARSLIRQLGVSFFRGKNLIGMSVYDESFERFLESKGLRFVMVRVVPNPKTSDLEIVREYRDAAKETNHILNFNSLEAFINAGILFDILKRIKPPLTKEKIIKEIESIKNYNFKGIELDFDPDSRELVRTLWLDTGEGPWIKKEVRAASNDVEKDKKKEAPPAKEKEKPEPVTEKKKTVEVAQEDDKQQLTFGATMDLSKSASPIGKKVREGLNLRFDQARQKGELPNLSLKLVTQDDEYTPEKTREEVERFINNLGISMIIGSQGSPSLESYLDLIKDGKVLVMFPFTGAPIFRKPDLKDLIHFRGSYVREGEELIKYALDKRKAKKVAIFYQDDAFGKGPLEGARRALKEAGITDSVEIPHARNDVNFKSHAEILQKEDPDTILFSTNATPIRGLIRQMGVDFFSGKTLLGVSVYEDAFEQFLKDKGLNFILIRMVPDPKTSDLEIAREYRAAADAAGLSYDKVSFEMYINASILFDFLKRIKGPVTKEKIIEIAEQTKNYPFKGLTLDFNEETRELSPVLWLDTGRGEWVEKSREVGEVKKEEVVEKEDEAEPAKELKVGFPAKEPKKALANGGERKPLLIGSTIDLSKGVKQQGIAVKKGIELRLKEAAEANDQSIGRVFIVDDEYTPIKTRQEIESFLERDIDIMLAPVGSPTLASYLDLVKEGKVLVLFPITGAPLFRSPDLTYIVHIRPSYKTEGKILTEYALDTLKTKKGVMFYQDDAFGQGLLDGAREVLKDRGVTDWIEVPYQRNDVSFQKQVEKIKKYDPDTILFFSTTTAASGLIRQIGIQEVSSKKMLANSDFGEEQFLSFVKKKGLKLIYLNVVPNPLKSKLAIVEQFRNAAQKYNVSLDTFSLEPYIATDFLLDILHKIEGEITKKKIIDAIEKVKDYDYKGLRFNFDPETRTLSSTFWMNAGGADWQVLVVKT